MNVMNQESPQAGMPQPISSPTAMPAIRLPGTLELFREAWGIYRSRLGAIVVPMCFVLLFALLQMSMSKLSTAPAAVLHLIVALLAVLLNILFVYTAIAAITADPAKEAIGFRAMLKKAGKLYGSIVWLAVLRGIVSGSAFLLLIPGIVFSVWFLFAPYILLTENIKGMNAMLRSKAYVKGVWFPVFGRLFLMALIFFVAAMILAILMGAVNALLGKTSVASLGVMAIIQAVIILVFIPLGLTFVNALYLHIRAAKGDVAVEAGTGKKALYLGIGILGWVVGLLIFALFIFLAIKLLQAGLQQMNSLPPDMSPYTITLPSVNPDAGASGAPLAQ